MTGVIINDLLKLLAEDTNEKTHAIIIYDMLIPNEPLINSLVLKGITIYLLSRKPRTSKYDDASIMHIDMTSKAPLWEPS